MHRGPVFVRSTIHDDFPCTIDRAVLLKEWAHASSKSARFGLQELVGTPLTVPCGPIFSTSDLRQDFARIALVNFIHKKRLAAVQTVSVREHVFMLQNCASECVSNRTYRTLQEMCDEGAPCSSGPGSEALIGRLQYISRLYPPTVKR